MHDRFVSGMPLYQHTLLRADATAQDRLAQQLAMFLRQLQAIPLSDVPAPPWQTVPPPASRRSFYAQRLAALEQQVYPLLWADQKAWVSDLFAPVTQATIDRARFLAGAIELEWALNSVQPQDLSLLLVHLGRARDSLPVLTPWV